MASLSMRNEEVEALKVRLAETISENDMLRAYNDDLELRMTQSRSLVHEEAQEVMTRLRVELSSARKELTSVDADVACAVAKLGDEQAKVEKLRKEQARMSSAVAKMKAMWAKRVQAMKAKLLQAKTEQAKAQIELAKSQEDVRELNAYISNDQCEVFADLRATKEALKKAQAERCDISREYAGLKRAHEEASASHAELQKTFRNVRARLVKADRYTEAIGEQLKRDQYDMSRLVQRAREHTSAGLADA